MPQTPPDEEREERINNEIIVDAYGPEEQAIGWYYYLQDTLQFPFRARCIAERAISPLRVNDEIQVDNMGPAGECRHEMFVQLHWQRRSVAVPLIQLEGVSVDEETRHAIEDWHYWIARGYEL